MDKEEIKNRINLDNIQEFIEEKDLKKGIFDTNKYDYLVDFEGNFIVPLSPLDVVLIERIKELELRIKKLEEINK